MDEKLLKCPVCGGKLNAETDSGHFVCRRCGAKLTKDAERIAVEHANVKAEEADPAKTNRIKGRITMLRRCRRIGNIAAVVLFAASFFVNRAGLNEELNGQLKVIAIVIFAAVNLLYYILSEVVQRRS